MRIVFFGTPGFAVGSLSSLVQSGANVVAVVTAPDKPAGRGQQMHSSAVKQFAMQQGIPVLQPLKLKDPSFIDDLASYKADLHIVVAFRMLPVAVWDMPPLGTVNVHASLLPQYRGAAPINWAIINGETETGVTTFRLKHEIDTGNILLQKTVPILPEDNAGTLHDKLMDAGAELLVSTVKGLADGTLTEVPQADVTDAILRHAPKIFKDDTLIHWQQPVKAINDLIRGLSPNPAAYTLFDDRSMKIYQAHYEPAPATQEIGTHDTDHKTYFRFAAADGWIYIDELQMEGKKRMSIVDFLRGFRA
ncbi:MAG: methionyl-tRNA formyltransferase [Taibaiella sp.]|nr:methionyl-tRNA formyltransferase [Taibaiella sp.]